MLESKFWRYKAMVSGFMMTIGVLCLVAAAAGLGFGIFFSVKTQVQKPTPILELQVGKKFTQKLPMPVADERVSIVFDKAISKEMPKYPDDVRMGTLNSSEPLNFKIDLGGGMKDDAGKPLHPDGIATFSIRNPKLGRSKKSQWRLSDDDVAKFTKFYTDFLSKQVPDPEIAKNDEYAGDGYHYAWVFFFWGVVLVGLSIVIRRFDPDLYT